MELKRGYKQTELGLIPEDWEILPIDKIFSFYSTSNYSKAQMDFDGDVGCIHYGLIHAIPNSIYDVKKGIKYYVTKEQASYETIKNGDIVMVDASEDLEGVNKSIELFGIEDELFIAGLHTYLLRDSNSILANRFRGAILNSSTIKSQFNKLAVGMKVFGVSKPQLRTVLIPVPNKAEQTAIATALSDMDNLIAGLETLIEKKKAIKQGAMQELLRPKEGWVVKRLGECLLKSPDYGINAAAVSYSDTLPTYIRITDISNDGRFLSGNKTSVNHPLSDKYCLEENDIVFARTGASVGKTYLYNKEDGRLVYAGFLIRVKPDPRFLNSIYLQNFTTTQKYWNWVSLMSMRSGQPGINGNEFAQLEIPIPATIEEQNEIAHILSEMDSEIHNLKLSLSKYASLKQGMMHELLTGKTRLV